MKKLLTLAFVLTLSTPCWATTHYFVDGQGNYLGGFDGAQPPLGSTEITTPPVNGLDKYDFNAKSFITVDHRTLQEQLDTLYETLSVPQKASLAPLKAAIKLELDQGHADVAKAIIQGATIPPELEPLRTQLLSKF